jgi:hypothetical protein
MRHLVESFSLGSGAILIAILSAGFVWLLCLVSRVPLHALWVVIVPFFFAYSLYWLPVWLGADPSEYGAWAFLGVGVWFLAGFFPSALIARKFGKRRTK